MKIKIFTEAKNSLIIKKKFIIILLLSEKNREFVIFCACYKEQNKTIDNKKYSPT